MRVFDPSYLEELFYIHYTHSYPAQESRAFYLFFIGLEPPKNQVWVLKIP